VEPARLEPPSAEECGRILLFRAQRLPEVCAACGAPSAVCWAAAVFYRRFFAARSPAEFDPLLVLLACVHLACKVEEVHEVTLDRVLEAAGLGEGEGARVSGAELPLLEAVGFQLFLEPKPDTALRMLAEDVRRAVPEDTLTDAGWCEVVQRAEATALDLALRTDAALRCPASALIAAALGAALGGHAACGEALRALLDAGAGGERQREAARSMLRAAAAEVEGLALLEEVSEDSVASALEVQALCLRVFERLRKRAAEQHEAHRLERRCRLREAKVPTPYSNLQRRGAALQALDDSDFAIHHPSESVAQDSWEPA